MVASDVPSFIELLRETSEDDIAEALSGACIALPITTHVEALELFNCVLDVLTGERDQAMATDQARIALAWRA
jgi:hypothetical protein